MDTTEQSTPETRTRDKGILAAGVHSAGEGNVPTNSTSESENGSKGRAGDSLVNVG